MNATAPVPAPSGTSRRNVLKAVAAAGVVASGSAVLTSCSSSEPETSDVTMSVAGSPTSAPYSTMPDKKLQKSDKGAKAYAAVLQKWLDDNPGVKFKHIKQNLYDGKPETLTTAVNGGTAPLMFIGNVLASWNTEGIQAAFVQGLAADCAEAVEAYGFGDKISDQLKPAWDFWEMDGARYGLPYEYGGGGIGDGMVVRVDLLKEMGEEMPELTPETWNWEVVRDLAKKFADKGGDRKGLALLNWQFWYFFGSNGHSVLSEKPSPRTNWNWEADWSSNKELWTEVIETFRGMNYDDKSILSDVALQADGIAQAAGEDKLLLKFGSVAEFFASEETPNTVAWEAKKRGVEVPELARWIRMPFGKGGVYDSNSAYSMAMVSFNPDADEDEIDKAVSFHTYMMSEGIVEQMKLMEKDGVGAKTLWSNPSPYMVPGNPMFPICKNVTERIPGSPEEAWGPELMGAIEAAQKLPVAPGEGEFFPPEEEAYPPSKPTDDAIGRWAYEKNVSDIPGEIEKIDKDVNSARKNFKTSTDDAEFVKAASKYYAELDKFWAKNAPAWHSEYFSPWYQNSVKSNLGA